MSDHTHFDLFGDPVRPAATPEAAPAHRGRRRVALAVLVGLVLAASAFIGGAWLQHKMDWPFRSAGGYGHPPLAVPLLGGSVANPLRPETSIAQAAELQRCVQEMQARNFTSGEARVVCGRTVSPALR